MSGRTLTSCEGEVFKPWPDLTWPDFHLLSASALPTSQGCAHHTYTHTHTHKHFVVELHSVIPRKFNMTVSLLRSFFSKEFQLIVLQVSHFLS